MIETTITIESWKILVLVVLAIWELVWKGLGLWKSAQKKEKIWFVLILILNTIGILPIIYLLINRNSKKGTRK